MSEADLNKRLREALKGFDPVRVENAVGPGTPDINYLQGWIESKFLHEWPKRADSIVRIPHYVKEQRGWHVRRCAAGGRVWVALEVGDCGEFHLIFADLAAASLGRHWHRFACQANSSLYLPKWDTGRVRKFFLEFHGLSRYSVDPTRRGRS